MSIDEYYYKPIRTRSVFNGNYIEYEIIGVKEKILTIKGYLDVIRPYLSDLINDSETQYEWRIQLIMAINFISFKDSNETRTMCTKSDSIEITMGSETDKTIEELFESLLQRYQERLEESMNGSEFAFDSSDLLFFKFNKIILDR